jgi:hypothetical protein
LKSRLHNLIRYLKSSYNILPVVPYSSAVIYLSPTRGRLLRRVWATICTYYSIYCCVDICMGVCVRITTSIQYQFGSYTQFLVICGLYYDSCCKMLIIHNLSKKCIHTRCICTLQRVYIKYIHCTFCCLCCT